MSNTGNQTIICQEIFDESSQPSDKEVHEYALTLGIDPVNEPHLLLIARDGLMQALPTGWKPCYDSSLGRYYYYNIENGSTQWEHPLDPIYKEKVKRGRSEGYSSAASQFFNSGEDDSKATAKEDLKSFDEVSDMLSSRSADSKLARKVAGGQTSPTIQEEGAASKGPLLARRAMNQLRHDSLPSGLIPVSVESSFLSPSGARSNSLTNHDKDDVAKSDSSRITGLQSQPLAPTMRRSQTLDEVQQSSKVPGGGILRESPSTPFQQPRRLLPIPSGSVGSEAEEDKKRSVRFADMERKCLDIKFDFSASEESVDMESDSSSNDNIERRLKERGRLVKSESKSSVESEKTVESSNSGSGDKTKQGGKSSPELNNSCPTSSKLLSKPSDTSTSPPHVYRTQKLIRDSSLSTEDSSTAFEMRKRKLMEEKIIAIEKQLVDDFQQKIDALNEEVNKNLMAAKLSIRKKETNEIIKIRDEHEAKMKELKEKLDVEMKTKEQNFRDEKERELSALIDNLVCQNKQKYEEECARLEKELEELQENHRKSLLDQAASVESIMQQSIDRSDKLLSERINALKEEEENKLAQIRSEFENLVEEAQRNYEETIKELELKCQREKSKMEDDHQKTLNQLTVDKESEMRRIEAEWQDKITACISQHKIIIESAVQDHDKRLQLLKSQFLKNEEDLKKKHAEQLELWNMRIQKMADREQTDLSQINREFEKMRCEKRLLEDKYRSLKDKYIQMKTEMRIAIERRLQRKKRALATEETGGGAGNAGGIEVRIEHSPNNNNTCLIDGAPETKPENVWPSTINNNNNNRLEPPSNLDNDPSSTEENLLTSTSTTFDTTSDSKKFYDVKKEPSKRKLKDKSPAGAGSGEGTTPLDNIKSQLIEYDYLGEPSKAPDTYLRYPFPSGGGGNGGANAEVDFYRHRVVVEREAIRQARECLAQQKRELEERQSMLKHAAATSSNTSPANLLALQQQERDLTEMEVSLHRTRALLGEKMIRLRLLGQTLGRIDPSPSPTTANAGIATTGTAGDVLTGRINDPHSQYLENLDNINAEIREIWAALDSQVVRLSPSPVAGNNYNVTRIGQIKNVMLCHLYGLLQGLNKALRETENTLRYSLRTVNLDGSEKIVVEHGRLAVPVKTRVAERPKTLSVPKRSDVESKLAGMKDWLQLSSKRASLTL